MDCCARDLSTSSNGFPVETASDSTERANKDCCTDVIKENRDVYFNLPLDGTTQHTRDFQVLVQQIEENQEAAMTPEASIEMMEYRITTETYIDTTAQMLPSGRMESHSHVTKTAVSETLPPQSEKELFLQTKMDDFSGHQPSTTDSLPGHQLITDNLTEHQPKSSLQKFSQEKQTVPTTVPFTFGTSSTIEHIETLFDREVDDLKNEIIADHFTAKQLAFQDPMILPEHSINQPFCDSVDHHNLINNKDPRATNLISQKIMNQIFSGDEKQVGQATQPTNLNKMHPENLYEDLYTVDEDLYTEFASTKQENTLGLKCYDQTPFDMGSHKVQHLKVQPKEVGLVTHSLNDSMFKVWHVPGSEKSKNEHCSVLEENSNVRRTEQEPSKSCPPYKLPCDLGSEKEATFSNTLLETKNPPTATEVIENHDIATDTFPRVPHDEMLNCTISCTDELYQCTNYTGGQSSQCSTTSTGQFNKPEKQNDCIMSCSGASNKQNNHTSVLVYQQTLILLDSSSYTCTLTPSALFDQCPESLTDSLHQNSSHMESIAKDVSFKSAISNNAEMFESTMPSADYTYTTDTTLQFPDFAAETNTHSTASTSGTLLQSTSSSTAGTTTHSTASTRDTNLQSTSSSTAGTSKHSTASTSDTTLQSTSSSTAGTSTHSTASTSDTTLQSTSSSTAGSTTHSTASAIETTLQSTFFSTSGTTTHHIASSSDTTLLSKSFSTAGTTTTSRAFTSDTTLQNTLSSTAGTTTHSTASTSDTTLQSTSSFTDDTSTHSTSSTSDTTPWSTSPYTAGTTTYSTVFTSDTTLQSTPSSATGTTTPSTASTSDTTPWSTSPYTAGTTTHSTASISDTTSWSTSPHTAGTTTNSTVSTSDITLQSTTSSAAGTTTHSTASASDTSLQSTSISTAGTTTHSTVSTSDTTPCSTSSFTTDPTTQNKVSAFDTTLYSTSSSTTVPATHSTASTSDTTPEGTSSSTTCKRTHSAASTIDTILQSTSSSTAGKTTWSTASTSDTTLQSTSSSTTFPATNNTMSTSQSTPPTADITFQGPSSTSETKILNTSSTTDASFHISAFNNKATFHNTFPTATDSNFQSTTPIDKTTIHSTASPICESFHTPASSIDSDFYNLFHFAQSMSSSSNSPCQSTTSSADYTYHKNDPSPDPPYQSSTTSSYLSFESTTSSTDLLYPSNISSSNPSLQQSEVPPNPPWQGSNSSKSLFEAGSNQNGTILCDPIKKCSLTSTDSMNACTFSLDPSNNCATASSDSTDLCTTPPDLFTEHSSSDSDLQSLFVRDEIDEATPSSSQNTIRLSIEDEYGTLIKQNDQIFRDELRKIFLDHQGQGFTLLDSGIVVTRSVTVENTTALVKLRDGSELGMTVSHSNLFLYYQLGKQFYITEQLNEHWYYVQDRITKVVMLMKKVPVTSNWVKLLHNFLLLPKYPRLLTTYAAITNRDGFILFLMEGRPVLGLGIPPLRCAATRQICILGIILFLRYCKINNVLPRQTADSILYTHQGLWFDPSSLDGNDDLYELRKSLKSFFSIFLCRGQQELDLCFQVLLDIAHQLLEEDSWWPSQLRHASLAFSFPEGSVPFSLPGVD